MKQFFFLIFCLVPLTAMAEDADSPAAEEYGQTYTTDNLLADSVRLLRFVPSAEEGEAQAQAAPTSQPDTLFVPNGEEVLVVGKTSHSRTVVEYQGARWTCWAGDLRFAAPNEAGEAGTLQSEEQVRYHTALGHAFHSYVPFYLILFLLLCTGGAMVMAWRTESTAEMRPYSAVIIGGMLLASILEILAMVYTRSIIWWCDVDEIGFLRGLLLMLPLMLAIAIQLGVGWFFKLKIEVLTQKSLSWKSVFLGLLCLPAAIVAVIVVAICGLHGGAQDVAFCVIFFGGLTICFLWAWHKNGKALGRSAGLLFTLFSFVYVLGALIAVFALLKILWELFLVILTYLIMAAAAVFVFAFLGGSDSGSGGGGGGGGSFERVWYDEDGHAHNSETDARIANERIAERRAGG